MKAGGSNILDKNFSGGNEMDLKALDFAGDNKRTSLKMTFSKC